MGSQVPFSNIERGGQGSSRERCPHALSVEILRGSGTERTRGSYTPSGLDTSQAFDFGNDGDLEGKDSDKAVQELSQFEGEALLGEPFLGQGLFREHCRSG